MVKDFLKVVGDGECELRQIYEADTAAGHESLPLHVIDRTSVNGSLRKKVQALQTEVPISQNVFEFRRINGARLSDRAKAVRKAALATEK